MVVRLKFKGIDGGLYKWWSMWFNLRLCVKFYFRFDMYGLVGGNVGEVVRYNVYRCCMVVVSLCCEVLG